MPLQRQEQFVDWVRVLWSARLCVELKHGDRNVGAI
jgi:hypothetical protein